MLREVLLAVPASGDTPVESGRNLQWWRKDKAELHETALQAQALREPWMKDFTVADLGEEVVYACRRVGPKVTLDLLHAAKDSPGRQEAIVRAAVAFELVGSARRYCPPSEESVEAELQAHVVDMYQTAGFESARAAWLP